MFTYSHSLLVSYSHKLNFCCVSGFMTIAYWPYFVLTYMILNVDLDYFVSFLAGTCIITFRLSVQKVRMRILLRLSKFRAVQRLMHLSSWFFK